MIHVSGVNRTTGAWWFGKWTSLQPHRMRLNYSFRRVINRQFTHRRTDTYPDFTKNGAVSTGRSNTGFRKVALSHPRTKHLARRLALSADCDHSLPPLSRRGDAVDVPGYECVEQNDHKTDDICNPVDHCRTDKPCVSCREARSSAG